MELKIVTYNIKVGLYHPEGLEAIARVLEGLEADVIALQEVDNGTRRASGEDQTAWLARRLAMPYHHFGPATPWEGGGEYGVALIAALPMLNASVEQLWVPRGKDVPHGAREPRVVLRADVAPIGDSPRLTVMVTHLGLTQEQRLRQAQQLLEQVRALDGRPVVVAGDFNGSPDSPEVETVASSLDDTLGKYPEKERITFPSGDPEMHGEDYLARSIDYIFVSREISVESARVVAEYSLASDHNPCEATVIVP